MVFDHLSVTRWRYSKWLTRADELSRHFYFRLKPEPNLTALTTTLKQKCRHFDEILITGCTESCQNDNFRCSQWLKFHQNDISVSVESISITLMCLFSSALYHTFHRLYSISHDVANLELSPPGFKARMRNWLGNSDELMKAAKEQARSPLWMEQSPCWFEQKLMG